MAKKAAPKKAVNKTYLFALIFLILFVLGELAFLFTTIGTSKNVINNQKFETSTESQIDPKTGCKNNWNFYESSRYKYTFCYPSNWHTLFYDENDPTIVYGTHTIFSYNYKNAVNYSKKGVVNWTEFVGDEPQVKFDIDIPNARDNKIVLENPELKMMELNKTTGQSYWNIQKRIGEHIVSFNIFANNFKDVETLQNSKNWKLLVETISTIK